MQNLLLKALEGKGKEENEDFSLVTDQKNPFAPIQRDHGQTKIFDKNSNMIFDGRTFIGIGGQSDFFSIFLDVLADL